MTNTIIRYGFVAIMVAMVAQAVTGCDLGDVITVKTPQGIQQSEGLPATMTLNESAIQYRLWYERMQVEGAQWKNSIDRGREVAGVLSQLFMSEVANSSLAAYMPLLAPILGIAGIGAGRAGLAKEKEKSYNKGYEKGLVVPVPESAG